MEGKTTCVWEKGSQLTILAQVSTDPRRTAAAPSDGITGGAIFTLAGEGAVFTKLSLGTCYGWKIKELITAELSRPIQQWWYVYLFVCLTLVADDADPSVGAVAASFPWIAFSTIRTVVTRQTAVIAESVIQTHWKRQQVRESSERALIVTFDTHKHRISSGRWFIRCQRLWMCHWS